MTDSKPCRVDECGNPRLAPRTLCRMHHKRWQRLGSLTLPPRRESGHVSSHGYLAKRAPGHPLAAKNGALYEHRRVLFEHLGWSPTPCAWCGRTLTWRATDVRDRLEVDHFNGDKTDNDPINLLPCCHSCNSIRAHRDQP